MNGHLFIGGSLDGQWIETTSRFVCNPVVREPPRIPGNDSSIAQNVMVDRDEYMRCEFRFLSGVRVVYAMSNMNQGDIFERLIEHYKPTN